MDQSVQQGNNVTQQQQSDADATDELIARTLAEPPLVLRCKVVLLGDNTVGKTSLAQVFTQGGMQHFSKNYNMTVGMELSQKAVHIPDTNVKVEMYIVDCAGFSGLSQDLLKPHWESANAAMLVYDVSDPNTFHNLTNWFDEVVRSGRQEQGLTGLVVANKTDLADRPNSVPAEMGMELSKRLGFEFFEVCASQGNVDEPFNFLGQVFNSKYEERLSELGVGHPIHSAPTHSRY